MPAQATRDRFATLTPYLMVHGVATLIEFLKAAFDAEVHECLRRPDGAVKHAELQIGDSMIMMGEPGEQLGVMPGSIYLHVPDCDAVYEQAIAAGAQPIMPMADKPDTGERYGGVRDGSGNIWWIGMRLETEAR